MKWSRSEFQIVRHGERETVAGYVSSDGIWGIFRDVLGPTPKSWAGYRVVNIPTGSHAGSYGKLAEAKVAAELVASVPVDWTAPDLAPEHRDYLRRVWRAVSRGFDPPEPWSHTEPTPPPSRPQVPAQPTLF